MLLAVACAPAARAPGRRTVPAGSVTVPDGETPASSGRSPWFTGVVVSRILTSEPKGSDPRITGEQQFFVSGSNLYVRETDADGNLVLELSYDPERNVLYQLAPDFAIIEPREPSELQLAFTGNIQTILGYTCHELSRRGSGAPTLAYVAPGVRIDPSAFRNFQFDGFSQQLEFTGGALELSGQLDFADHTLFLEAVRVERRVLGDETWKLGEARARQP